MDDFKDFNLSKPLFRALEEIGLSQPTPIQRESFSPILSGRDLVGIAQTGTGKTFAFLLPLLHELKFSKQIPPRVLILVPTRELVVQIVDNIARLTQYMNVRTLGVYGGANINTQSQAILMGVDILVATPGRLYDLTLNNILQLKAIKKLVIDEVDVMLDLGFRPQLTSILELLPEKRQNIMFSATMTDHVDVLINDFFRAPNKVEISVSGTPLDTINQTCYSVPNFYTKINLLIHLLRNSDEFKKVIVFISHKRYADRLFEKLNEEFGNGIGIIHSNKSQNFRNRSVEEFDNGTNRVLVTTDIMARGIDLDKVTHVINFDTPNYPENYIHRIGRTGRAEQGGESILFFTPKEEEHKVAIEKLMQYEIPQVLIPSEVKISNELTHEEQPQDEIAQNLNRSTKHIAPDTGFHEKKEKNKKTNLGGSYKRKIKKKYKKPQTRGDKTYHKRQKRG